MILRPAVGMQQYVAVPYVVALGVCDAYPGVGIAWPHDVVAASDREPLCALRTHAGYDDGGMFVDVELCGFGSDEQLLAAVEERVSAWAHDLAGKPRMAPLAYVLAEYTDRLVDFGKEVQVTYPNGRLYAEGVFAGVDIWGRATVRLATGVEVEFAPEKFRIRPRA